MRSDVLCNNLINLGCTPRKSLTLKFPNINPIYHNHFIRGYFDGDGSVFVVKEKHWRTKKINDIIIMDFVGTYEFLQEVQTIFIPVIGDKIRLIKVRKDDKNTFNLRCKRNKRALPFYNYLYKNATIYLNRKKEVFDKHFTKLDIQRL